MLLGDFLEKLVAFGNLAELYALQGKYDLALSTYELVVGTKWLNRKLTTGLRSFEKQGVADLLSEYSHAMARFVDKKAEGGDQAPSENRSQVLNRALAFQLRALELHAERGATVSVALDKRFLADIYMLRGESKAALREARESLSMAYEARSSDPWGYEATLANILLRNAWGSDGSVDASLLGEASELALRSAAAIAYVRSQLASEELDRSFLDEGKQQVLNDLSRSMRARIFLAASSTLEERRRAFAAVEIKKEGYLVRSLGSSMRAEDRLRGELIGYLPRDPLGRTEIGNELLRQISDEVGSVFRERPNLVAAVFDWQQPYGPVVWRLESDEVTAYYIEDADRDLAAKVGEYVEYLSQRKELDSKFYELGQSLYDSLVAPWIAGVSLDNEVVIVPDGLLWRLPFEALVHSSTGSRRYLIEDTGQLTYAPSMLYYARLLAGDRSDRIQSPAMYLFGKSSFGSFHLNGWANPLPDLAFVAKEVERIGSMFPDSIKFEKGGFTKESFRGGFGRGASVLHVASHSILVRDGSRGGKWAIVLDHDPDKKDSGLLDYLELSELKGQIDIVVLSMCSAADGEIVGGEGVLSLSRTFQRNGSRSIVATLWPVNEGLRHECGVRQRPGLPSSPQNGLKVDCNEGQ